MTETWVYELETAATAGQDRTGRDRTDQEQLSRRNSQAKAGPYKFSPLEYINDGVSHTSSASERRWSALTPQWCVTTGWMAATANCVTAAD